MKTIEITINNTTEHIEVPDDKNTDEAVEDWLLEVYAKRLEGIKKDIVYTPPRTCVSNQIVQTVQKGSVNSGK